jgi:hypothetical protein
MNYVQNSNSYGGNATWSIIITVRVYKSNCKSLSFISIMHAAINFRISYHLASCLYKTTRTICLLCYVGLKFQTRF